MQYYVSDRATVSLSARHDDYSDFGTAVSWRIGGAYDLLDNLTMRGSYGSNFIPPSMTELYGADSESYPFTIDYVACDSVGTSEEDCKGRQYASYTQSATNLDAETSENLSLGLCKMLEEYASFRLCKSELSGCHCPNSNRDIRKGCFGTPPWT